MSENIIQALKEINEAYEHLKDILRDIIHEYNLDNSEIVGRNYDFLDEIGVLE
ncbi:MAG: hypothetical protein ACFFDF_08035 [Candidatus Odinarchaeota archaeon]